MSNKRDFVTIRLPNSFDELINKYIEVYKEEMTLRGLRTSRASVVKIALYELFIKKGLIQEKGDQIVQVSGKNTTKDSEALNCSYTPT